MDVTVTFMTPPPQPVETVTITLTEGEYADLRRICNYPGHVYDAVSRQEKEAGITPKRSNIGSLLRRLREQFDWKDPQPIPPSLISGSTSLVDFRI